MRFEPFLARSPELGNRGVASPMTRTRAVEAGTPDTLMTGYCGRHHDRGRFVPVAAAVTGRRRSRRPRLFELAATSV